jgi:hypothetical protein
MPIASRSRRALVALLAVVLVGFAWAPASAEAATSSSPDSARTAAVHSASQSSFDRKAAKHKKHKKAKHRKHKKHAKKHKKKAAASTRASYLWQGSRIYYYDALPAKWHWSVTRAVAQWNALGGGIRFSPTTIPSKAQLTIRYGSIGQSAGLATVGRTAHASVRLSNGYDSKDALDAHYRIEVMAVLTHELGHVLGYEHTSTKCSLMSPMMDIVGCGDVSSAHPGYYKCRIVDATQAARFIRNYGGRLKSAGGSWCLIDPLPSVLSGVVFDNSGSGVNISWAQPSYAPSGSRVAIQHWTGEGCDAPSSAAATDYADAVAGSWANPDTSATADNCYKVQLVNRYGAAATSTDGTTFARTAPANG